MANAKKIGLFVLGAAFQRFLTELEDQQEVLAGITDVLMYAYAIESVHLRNSSATMTAVFTEYAYDPHRGSRSSYSCCKLGRRRAADESRDSTSASPSAIHQHDRSATAHRRSACWRRNDSSSRSGPRRTSGLRQIHLGANSWRRGTVER